MTNQITTHHQANYVAPRYNIENMFQIAQTFADAEFIPAHFRKKPADCFVALHMAQNMGEDPLIIMQNMCVIKGTPGWKAQYMIARAANCGVFSGGITWDIEGKGEDLKVTAKATLAKTGEVVTSPVVDFKMAHGEKWTVNEKYKTMPELMFRYRSAAFLIRLFAPQVMLGYQTIEEVETLPNIVQAEPKRLKKQGTVQIAHTPEPEPVAPEDYFTLLEAVGAAETIANLSDINKENKALIARLKATQPDLHKELVQAFIARGEEIKSPAPESDEDTAA
jgi:hypothetical protein